MDAKTLIEAVIAAGVLSRSEVKLPGAGATDIDLKSAEERIGTGLNPELETLLRSWDGANLDVVRLYPCKRLEMTELGTKFADDPAGFVYYLNGAGEVVEEDTDGGEITTLATSFNDFIQSYLFGNRSAEFMGEEWHQQLVKAGFAT